MTDPDWLPVCRCLHDTDEHADDGCLVEDDLGNRCACEQAV